MMSKHPRRHDVKRFLFPRWMCYFLFTRNFFLRLLFRLFCALFSRAKYRNDRAKANQVPILKIWQNLLPARWSFCALFPADNFASADISTRAQHYFKLSKNLWPERDDIKWHFFSSSFSLRARCSLMRHFDDGKINRLKVVHWMATRCQEEGGGGGMVKDVCRFALICNARHFFT